MQKKHINTCQNIAEKKTRRVQCFFFTRLINGAVASGPSVRTMKKWGSYGITMANG
jgi:hypothetical protein